MALMNRHLEPTLETVFMMPAEQYTYLSSRLIKEVFSLGGEVRGLVPSTVEQWMRARSQSAQGQDGLVASDGIKMSNVSRTASRQRDRRRPR